MSPTASAQKSERLYEKKLKQIQSIMGNETTFSTDLMRIASKLLGRRFLGIYASDRLPKMSNVKDMAIINLDKSGMPGSHWCGVFYDSGRFYVYDSFGRATKKILPRTFKGRGRVIDSDYDSEQSLDSTNCGQRCISWLCVVKELGIREALKI